MAKVMALVSQKGGAGKSTVALNLATTFAEQERRVLLVDLDPQGALGLSLRRADAQWVGLTEHLMLGSPLRDVLVKTKLPGLSLLPRGRLDPMDALEFESLIGTRGLLESVVAPVADSFDLVIFDTPSGLGAIPRAALRASDWAVGVIQCEVLALRSLQQLLRLLEGIRDTENPKLVVLAFVLNMVDLGASASVNVAADLWTGFEGLLETHIPRSRAFLAASEDGLPLSHMGGPLAPEARRFEMLVEELESRMAKAGGWAAEERHHERRELV